MHSLGTAAFSDLGTYSEKSIDSEPATPFIDEFDGPQGEPAVGVLNLDGRNAENIAANAIVGAHLNPEANYTTETREMIDGAIMDRIPDPEAALETRVTAPLESELGTAIQTVFYGWKSIQSKGFVRVTIL